MYSFFIDSNRLPVSPSKLTLKIKNKNKTLDLMNLGEVNILKKPGLTDINFEVLLPSVEYPFAIYDNEFKDPSYYLAIFKKLKKDKRPFRFVVTRISPAGDFLFENNMSVSLEDYKILEDTNNGMDIVVSVDLKEFKDYATQAIKIGKTTNPNELPKAVIKEKRPAKEPPAFYTVSSGDNLWTICKQQLGDGGRYKEIAKLNDIKNPDLIIPGQVIRLR